MGVGRDYFIAIKISAVKSKYEKIPKINPPGIWILICFIDFIIRDNEPANKLEFCSFDFAEEAVALGIMSLAT